MSLKSVIAPRLIEHMLGEARLERRRAKVEAARIRAGAPHRVEFFHDPADPYSRLLHAALPAFEARYDVELITHRVGPPDDGAAPEREKLATYARIDAARLAAKAGLPLPPEPEPTAADTSAGDARRAELGHYLSGMLHYGGAWYWGLDRLHYLEARLAGLGAGAAEAPLYAPPSVPSGRGQTSAVLYWYLSFRSPYTAIVRDRVKALADAYGAELRLRFVFPMVMRGLPVPGAKRRYILTDTAREARRLRVGFGRVLDPVGKPVELGYSLLPWAREQGRDYAYAQSWLTGVWTEGLDAGRDTGLRQIVERAGLDWAGAKTVLGNQDWRDEEKANRADMMARGIWGVPSFRVGDTITWGQDRLWVVEDALKKLA